MESANRQLCIRFEPGYQICNYKCSYCIIGWGGTRNKNWDVDRFKDIMERIKILPYSIDLLLGVEGEVFTSKLLIDSVVDLTHCANINSIYLITNLSLKQTKLEAFLHSAVEDKLAFACTLHKEQANFDEFIKKVVFLHKRGVPVIVGSVAAPGALIELKRLKRYLKKQGVPLYVNALSGKNNGKLYPQDYNFFERIALRSLIYSAHEYSHMVNMKNTFGEPCKAGFSYIYLNYDGKIFRCGEEKNRGFSPIGDLLAKDLGIAQKSSPCSCESCFCPIESFSTVRFSRLYLPSKNRRIYRKKSLLQRFLKTEAKYSDQ